MIIRALANPSSKPKAPRREHILRAAETLFAKHGVHAVTSRQIAKRVGISQPSIYAHFGSVHEIQEEVSARAFGRLEHRLAKIEDDDVETQVRELIEHYVAFGFEFPQAYEIAFMVEQPHASGEDADGESYEAFAAMDHPGPRAFGHVVRIVASARPDLEGDALIRRAQSLWAMLHGLVALLLARPHFPWTDRDGWVAEHCALAFHLVMADGKA